LVAQLVEQCPFNSKTPILAIFSSFYFPFATIAKPLISLVIIRISMSSLVVSQNPKVFIRVTSRVQVFIGGTRALALPNFEGDLHPHISTALVIAS
jgi:hypothetical protein